MSSLDARGEKRWLYSKPARAKVLSLMRASLRSGLAGALATIGLACQPTSREGTLRVAVQLGAGLTSECVLVTVAGGGEQVSTSPMLRPRERVTPLVVGVSQGHLPDAVSVLATGYGPGCTDEVVPPERSEVVEARFRPYPPDDVQLTLRVEGEGDGGASLDGSAPDGGASPLTDGGVSTASDGGASAETDGGAGARDGGRGATDAGLGDAGGACGSGSGGCLPEFPYPPANFTEGQLADLAATDVEIGCQATLSTGAEGGQVAFDSGCQVALPSFRVITMSGGGSAVVLHARTFLVSDAGALTVEGDRPLIIAARGEARVDGLIVSFAGAERACAPPADGVTSGGGGGGFGRPGGKGTASSSTPGAEASGQAPSGTEDIVPLRGGCRGGSGGPASASGAGGRGGGAFQLSAVGTVTVNGRVAAPGRGGAGGLNEASVGGGGGGSGGALLLEGRGIVVGPSGRLTVNGGGGGEGGGWVGGWGEMQRGESSAAGEGGALDSDVPADGGQHESCGGNGGAGGAGSTEAQPARAANGDRDERCASATSGGGGGGGGVGRIRLNALGVCALQAGCVVSGVMSAGRAACR